MSINRPKLNSLQALRALAAMLVTIAHASEEAKYFFGFEPVFDTDPFGKGVDLFFVLSGFIIFYASHQSVASGALSAKDFLLNRITRVVPMYYLVTTLMVLVLLFFPAGVKEARLDWEQIATSYLFIPYERYDGRIAPTLSLGWTLNYELFFYGLFAACMAVRPRHLAALVCATLLSLALLGTWIPRHFPAPLREWTDSIIIEFAFGVMIAVAYERLGKLRAPWTLGVTLALGSLGLLYWLNLPEKPLAIPRFLSAGLPAASVLAACVLLLPDQWELKVPRLVVSLGDSSYALYLSHRFIQRPIQIIFRKAGLGSAEFAGALYVVASVLGAFLAGYLVFKWLEQPMLKFMRKQIGGSHGAQRPDRPSNAHLTSHAPR